MADHSELVAEMLVLEQMGTQERQKSAKKRRLQQIKKWSQREKEWSAKEKQMNKRLANRISEENNGLNLKHFTQYSLSETSPIKDYSKSPLQPSSNVVINNFVNNENYMLHDSDHPHHITSYKQNNTTSNGASIANNNNNNNIIRRNLNKSRSISLNGLDAKDVCSRPINSKVHFDPGIMLLEAAARDDVEEVKRLLKLGVSADSTNHDGLTTLHQCCIEASEPMINLLLEYGANVDARDTEQWTPLHAACTCGHLNLVKLLVERGADLLAVNGDGNMPFDLCEDEQTLDYLESQMVARHITQEMVDIARASTEMNMINDIQRYLDNGVDVNTITYQKGVTPLHVAAANGYLSASEFLIKHGSHVNACDNELWQPLHGVACWGNEQHISIVKLLVESGASLDAKTINGETVFDLCDNEQLLDKLNEIKDEIESKQAASDADRLRRTQSRTNSRIHSIRRTSVRDKSQISRRDALEEALFRSESGGSIGPADGLKIKIDNEAHPLKIFNGNYDDEENNETNENSRLRLADLDNQVDQQTNYQTTVSENNMKTDQRQDSGIETSYLSTDLDDRSDSTGSKEDTPIITPHIRSLKKNQNNYFDNNNIMVDTIQQEQSNSSNLLELSRIPLQGKSTLTNQQNLSTSSRMDSTKRNNEYELNSGRNESTSDNFMINNIDEQTKTTNQRASHNNNSTTHTPLINNKGVTQNLVYPNSQDPVTTTATGSTVIVQFQSNNYTLSNLKKQRSDIRLRTTSIGGGNVGVSNSGNNIINKQILVNASGTSRSTIMPEDSVNSTVLLEPNPMKPASNSLSLLSMRMSNSRLSSTDKNNLSTTPSSSSYVDKRSLESPDSSLRKFRGEPSELIGGPEGGSKNSCCSII